MRFQSKNYQRGRRRQRRARAGRDVAIDMPFTPRTPSSPPPRVTSGTATTARALRVVTFNTLERVHVYDSRSRVEGNKKAFSDTTEEGPRPEASAADNTRPASRNMVATGPSTVPTALGPRRSCLKATSTFPPASPRRDGGAYSPSALRALSAANARHNRANDEASDALWDPEEDARAQTELARAAFRVAASACFGPDAGCMCDECWRG